MFAHKGILLSFHTTLLAEAIEAPSYVFIETCMMCFNIQCKHSLNGAFLLFRKIFSNSLLPPNNAILLIFNFLFMFGSRIEENEYGAEERLNL